MLKKNILLIGCPRVGKSTLICRIAEKAISSPNPVIATILRNSYDFPDRIKAREDVLLFKVTVENRERLVDEIAEIINLL